MVPASWGLEAVLKEGLYLLVRRQVGDRLHKETCLGQVLDLIKCAGQLCNSTVLEFCVRGGSLCPP